MNPICASCSTGSCRTSHKCDNRHKKRSLKQDFGAAGNTKKRVQHTATTIEPTTAVQHKNFKNVGKKINNLKKTKCTKKQLQQDLKYLRKENARLNDKILSLGTSINMLSEQIQQEKNKYFYHSEVCNTSLLENDEYQCCICREVFIMPSLLNCSHMFCKWCIDKWLENNNQCPICRVIVIRYTHCLNMNNFIQRRMQLMPAKVRYAYMEMEEARAKEK